MRNFIQILVDKNDDHNKIIDKFGLCRSRYNTGNKNCISCIHKANKFTWLCNLELKSLSFAKEWAENRSDETDDIALIELTREECSYPDEKKQEIAMKYIKKIDEIVFIQYNSDSDTDGDN